VDATKVEGSAVDNCMVKLDEIVVGVEVWTCWVMRGCVRQESKFYEVIMTVLTKKFDKCPLRFSEMVDENIVVHKFQIGWMKR
jgi:hypothetical protein